MPILGDRGKVYGKNQPAVSMHVSLAMSISNRYLALCHHYRTKRSLSIVSFSNRGYQRSTRWVRMRIRGRIPMTRHIPSIIRTNPARPWSAIRSGVQTPITTIKNTMQENKHPLFPSGSLWLDSVSVCECTFRHHAFQKVMIFIYTTTISPFLKV